MQRAGIKLIVVAAALALGAAQPAVAGSAGEATLGSAAASAGRYFGAALDPDAFDERPYRELAATQLTSVTPENAMKWGLVEPIRGEFDWKGADALVAFARANGQKIRGHTLVWHSQLPLWLINGAFRPDEIKNLMVAHIMEEASRYKGAIYAWDVVNEPFTDDGQWRKSIWYDAMGPDYIAIALRAARAADPDGQALCQRLQRRNRRPQDAGALRSYRLAQARGRAYRRRRPPIAFRRRRRAQGHSVGDGKVRQASGSTSPSLSSTSASACPPTTRRSRSRRPTTRPSSAPAGRRRAASGSRPGA